MEKKNQTIPKSQSSPPLLEISQVILWKYLLTQISVECSDIIAALLSALCCHGHTDDVFQAQDAGVEGSDPTQLLFFLYFKKKKKSALNMT